VSQYLKELVELSKIDKQLDAFAPQIESARAKITAQEAKVSNITDQIETLEHHVQENKNKIIAFEEQIGSLDDQLKSIAKKNKEITNEKEMKALSLEEEIAKEKLAFANEEIERLNKINDSKSAELAELADQLKELRVAVDAATSDAEAELAAIDKEKQKLFKTREERAFKVDQKALAFYEKIRRWAGNTAVVPVKKQACYGCYMKINDKTYSEVIKGEDITLCPHCGRILYLEKEEEAAEVQ
jgi:predicted  nucleic acid-binding Zn-ribbon protein